MLGEPVTSEEEDTEKEMLAISVDFLLFQVMYLLLVSQLLIMDTPAELGDDTASVFDSNVLVDNIDCRTRGSYQRDINLGITPAGDYYLQFRWKAGDGGTYVF